MKLIKYVNRVSLVLLLVAILLLGGTIEYRHTQGQQQTDTTIASVESAVGAKIVGLAR